MDSSGEGCGANEQPASKIPRLSKTIGTRRKIPKEIERPSSAKAVSSLENKFKSTMIKFNRELKEMQIQSEKLNAIRDGMLKIREELLEKGSKDPPNLPNIPDIWPSAAGRPLSPGKTGKLPTMHPKLKEHLEAINKKCSVEAGVIDVIASELPVLEKTYNTLEESLRIAHEKQGSIECCLNLYKEDITNIMNNIRNIEAIKKNSQLLLQELQNIKDEFQRERILLRNEIDSKEEEINKLRKSVENEIKKRKELEHDLTKLNESNGKLQEECNRYALENERIQKVQSFIASSAGANDLAIQNGQLKYELEDLKTKYSLSQEKEDLLARENDRFKLENCKLTSEKEAMKSDLVHHVNQTIFDKENRIYSIKSKMDSLVNLKNNILTREGKGEHFYNLEHIMNLSDCNILKNEVVNLHKKLQDVEDARSKVEGYLTTKEVRLQSLEEELVAKLETLRKMEDLVTMMKMKDKENSELLSAIQLPHGNLKWKNSMEKEDKIKELVRWQTMQRDAVLDLEQQLKNSEEKYTMAEERRIRNEERIALLQIELAKCQYLR